MKDVLNLSKFASGGGSITYNETNAIFEGDFAGCRFQYFFRFVDKKFPDYKAAFPTEFATKMTVSKDRFISQIVAAISHANKTTEQINLTVKDGNVVLSAEDLDFETSTYIEVQAKIEGNSQAEIAFNGARLKYAIDRVMGGEITLAFSGANTGCELHSTGDPGKFLVMPLQIAR